MSKAWLEQSERGSLAAMKLLSWVTLKFGRRFGRFFLVPICLYFVLFSVQARRSSLDYLRRVLPRTPRWRDVLRHYHSFASTVHDRLYMLTGRLGYFNVQVHGYAEVKPFMVDRGCILLGSHLGSFEVLRTLGMSEQSLNINVLMHEGNATKVTQIFDALNPAMKPKVIPMGQPDTLLKVHDCIIRNEIVGMLADRTFTSGKRVVCDFLGGKIDLPMGPLAVAAIMDVPVILFFGLYQGGNRYDLHFELFEASPGVERSIRDERVAIWMQRYADRLEHYCQLAPYNWFNFYPYWHD